MASLSRETIRKIIQVVLAVVIVVLAYILYESITEPWERIERQRQLTELTRERMIRIRRAMVRHEQKHGTYPHTLDSLVRFVESDTLLVHARDSMLRLEPNEEFVPDSLPFSPRTGKRFELVVNDTVRLPRYVLRDPDSPDSIGTVGEDVTRINAASWM